MNKTIGIGIGIAAVAIVVAFVYSYSMPESETQEENISAYIPTNVISITDGQIYLSNGRTKEATALLELALKHTPKDAELIYNLSHAYALNQQYGMTQATLKKLEEISPNFSGAADLKQQLEK